MSATAPAENPATIALIPTIAAEATDRPHLRIALETWALGWPSLALAATNRVRCGSIGVA